LKKNLFVFIILAISILLHSCSTQSYISKRKYLGGYYFDLMNKSKSEVVFKVENDLNTLQNNNNLFLEASLDVKNEGMIETKNELNYSEFIKESNIVFITPSDTSKKEKITLKKMFDPNFNINEFIPTENQAKKYVLLSFLNEFITYATIAMGIITYIPYFAIPILPCLFLGMFYNYLAKKYYISNPEYKKLKWLLRISFFMGAFLIVIMAISAYAA